MQVIEGKKLKVFICDVFQGLKLLPDESVNCVVTSPPYYRLRNYGIKEQIGLEPTIQLFIAKLVEVFKEISRVLTSDGTIWINIGDSYATGKGSQRNAGGGAKSLGKSTKEAYLFPLHRQNVSDLKKMGLKQKDLMMIPARLALALQDAGWWLRSEIVWNKPNPMPDSTKDRPGQAHEKIYMLTKSRFYYYNYKKVLQKTEPYRLRYTTGWDNKDGAHGSYHNEGRGSGYDTGEVRDTVNLRNVWTIPTNHNAHKGHYSAFPEDIPRLCIQAGCPPGGTVLDPFAGTGTTIYVARELGNEAIGIEIRDQYGDIIQERISQNFLY